MVLSISDKVDFRTRTITRNRDDCFIKRLKVHNDPKVYEPNNRSLNYVKRKLIEIQGKIDKLNFNCLKFQFSQ